ncbi:MAG TPA: pyridoxamine 5'-phosphate oxidase family protein [Acidimicrobiia bacterium]|nr:pyridoxamine 5'-phosphate oxidase family protein [Acidimicrobiia bacterium]
MSNKSLQMISWGEFAKREPELARFGAGRLTATPAYLATVRRSGAPRVHPVTPIFTTGGLFLFMEPTSPKGRDLRERGWFALHSGVPDNAGSGGEFNVSGRGLAIDDPDVWSHVADAASYTPVDRYILFEMRLSEARCHGYGDPLPSTRRWSVDQ